MVPLCAQEGGEGGGVAVWTVGQPEWPEPRLSPGGCQVQKEDDPNGAEHAAKKAVLGDGTVARANGDGRARRNCPQCTGKGNETEEVAMREMKVKVVGPKGPIGRRRPC